ncbi:hypothetical protein SAMN02910317_01783 [Ruminococcaceae bacterium FB2012]|nr:hypothetical protein SAMN02910317_01783 [Ruminococcaceae bacterium FB2012]
MLTILSALLVAGKDILNVGKKVGQLPGALTDSLNALAKGKLKINIAATELEDPMERLGSYVKYVVLSVIACVLFIGSCILAGIDLKPKTENGIPVIAMAGIVFSIALAIYSVGKLTKKKQLPQFTALRSKSPLAAGLAFPGMAFFVLIMVFSSKSIEFVGRESETGCKAILIDPKHFKGGDRI